jgi:methionine-S-sulfoxide reductase
VLEVTVGYAGGKAEFPTYKSIKDHTEACRVVFDPTKTTYRDILISMFGQHSPFGAPYSRQYRSAILVHNDEQKEIAESLIAQLQAGTSSKISTVVEPATDFYAAEEYHQHYIKKSRGLPYP